MKKEKAHELVERYFAGQSSLEDERALRAYFATGEVTEELRPYAPLFAYWERERGITAPMRKKGIRRLPRLLLALAAALLLFLIARGIHQQQQPSLNAFPVAERQPVDWSRYEITDKAEAVRVLKVSLNITGKQAERAPNIALRQLRTLEDILD